MKENVLELHSEAMQMIQQLAGRGDTARIGGVLAIANKLEQFHTTLVGIELELPELKERLASHATAGDQPSISANVAESIAENRSGKKKLRIQIDWSRLDKEGGKEIIAEHKSSDTMAKWASRLYQQFGIPVLQKLSKCRISRGPLVSTTPQSDFKNKTDGTVYSHQPILDSGYYILTHSQTTQKVGDLRRACQFLGYPIGAVSIDEVIEETVYSGF